MNPNPSVSVLKPMRLSDLVDEFQQDAATRYEARRAEKPLGALTGFKTIDREIGGALVPGLHILHAEPGCGKTALALQIGAQCGCRCLFVTCEMSRLELLRRCAARVTRQYLYRFKSGEFSPDEALGYAKQACVAAPYLILLDATQEAAPPQQLYPAIEATRCLDLDNHHLLIIVDSVHSWVRGWQPNEITETEALIAGIDALRRLAQRYSCAVIGITERNRASMKSGGQSAAAGTRVFEYGSETVISLACDIEEPEPQGYRSVTLRLEKNRHGASGKKIGLRFHGATQKFEEA